MDKFYVYRPLLDLIGFTEGTDKGEGYNETLAYGKMLDGVKTTGKGPKVELVKLTLTQLDALQTKMLSDPDNKKLNSSAAGRYQVTRTTQRNIRKALPEAFPATRLYDAMCQDEMACFLLGQRGIDKYLAGRLKEDTLVNELAKEWASFPTTANKGYYAGQHTPITASRVRQVLAEVRRRHAEGQPKEVIEKKVHVKVETPVVPPAIEKEVRQKTNWLSGLLTFLGGGTFSLSWLSGVDRDTLLIILGATGVGVAAFLVGGEWIVRRVRSIGKAIEE